MTLAMIRETTAGPLPVCLIDVQAQHVYVDSGGLSEHFHS